MALVIHGSRTTTRVTTNGRGVYTLAGTWAYALGGRRPVRTKTESRRYGDAHLEAVAKRGYKLGVKLKRSQAVEHFSFRGGKGGVVLAVDDEVSRELDEAFGADREDKWVGLVPPPGSRRRADFSEVGAVAYGFRCVVSGVQHEPQALVFLVTHRDVPFRQHYVMHVQFLTTRPERITASVQAMFTARARR
jgi:hypothetical protein